ncbi:unnamed protein product [Durusdinium trenchii]|uniref:Uncharacterized protein n=2 Tax=Durusdinium trenchii TaxID=1381693 RepID=A0ABP0QNQ3_9DINO
MMRPMVERRVKRIHHRKSCPASQETLPLKALPANVISMPDQGTVYKNCIHVTEEDLKRYGHDLTKLREHQVQPWERRHRERTLSFGESFEETCRKPAEVLDPWRNLPEPERLRPPNEGDLFLNQVVPKSPNRVAEEDDAEAEERRLSKAYQRISSNVSAASTAAQSSAAPSRDISRASSKESAKPGLQRAKTLPPRGPKSLAGPGWHQLSWRFGRWLTDGCGDPHTSPARPVDAPWTFELSIYSDDAAADNFLRWAELASLFGQSQGLHQEIMHDLLRTTLARRLLALAWQSHSNYLASLPLMSPSTSMPHTDLAVEQVRVNAQLASALDRFARGHRPTSKNPILRDHDSDDEDMDKFDLASVLKRTSHQFLPTDWFPTSQVLSKLQALLSKARESCRHQDHPFIADTPLESWVPLWVGHGESPSAREALVKQWRKTDQLDTARSLKQVRKVELLRAACQRLQFVVQISFIANCIGQAMFGAHANQEQEMSKDVRKLDDADQANGLTCPDRANCKLVHLDTTDPKEAVRYSAALQAYKAKRPKAAGLDKAHLLSLLGRLWCKAPVIKLNVEQQAGPSGSEVYIVYIGPAEVSVAHRFAPRVRRRAPRASACEKTRFMAAHRSHVWGLFEELTKGQLLEDTVLLMVEAELPSGLPTAKELLHWGGENRSPQEHAQYSELGVMCKERLLTHGRGAKVRLASSATQGPIAWVELASGACCEIFPPSRPTADGVRALLKMPPGSSVWEIRYRSDHSVEVRGAGTGRASSPRTVRRPHSADWLREK